MIIENEQTLIQEVGSLLRTFSEDLANMWLSKPYQRVNIARAFARGFVKDPQDDIHPTASIVLQAAMNLQLAEQNRQALRNLER